MTSRSIALCILIISINSSWCALQLQRPYHEQKKQIIESIIEKHIHFQLVISEVKRSCHPAFLDYACTRELIQRTAKKFDCPEPKIAIFLGTSHAIEYGKKYIAQHSSKYQNLNSNEYQDLRWLLIDAAQLHNNQLAWEEQDLSIAESVFAMGVSVEKDEDLCVSAILHAMHNGKTKFVELLLKKGVDVNTRFPDGGTLAMLAGYLGNEDIFRLLIHHKADLMATDNLGNTVSSFARENGKVGILEILANPRVIAFHMFS